MTPTSAPVFSLEALPAQHGDCLWLEYGTEADIRHVLIDGGPAGAFGALEARIECLPPPRRLELLVITHIDADHIEGAIRLLNRTQPELEIAEVWFNGWPQLQLLDEAPRGPGVVRGAQHGGLLQLRLDRRGVAWNERILGGPLMVAESGHLPRFEFPGGLTLTLLSPMRRQLVALKQEWERTYAARGAAPDDAEMVQVRLNNAPRYRDARSARHDPADSEIPTSIEDDAAANGSSIAVLAEFQGMRCALLADAFAQVLAPTLRRCASERGERRLRVDLTKLSHHGSARNLSQRLLDAMDCENFLVSTNGSRFGHPDAAAMNLLLAQPGRKRVFCNYPPSSTAPWAGHSRLLRCDAELPYPESPHGSGARVDITALRRDAPSPASKTPRPGRHTSDDA